MKASQTLKSISRERLFLLLRTALSTQSYRFARQASLLWLSAYSGDLEVGCMLAQALSGEGKREQAIKILERLVEVDPEFCEAQDALCKLGDQAGMGVSQQRKEILAALDSLAYPTRAEMVSFFTESGLIEDGMGKERQIVELITRYPSEVLPAIQHLSLVYQRNNDAETVNLAKIYHKRWPECLQIKLILADALIELGQDSQAIHLLHESVARDAAAQVARRLWGSDFKYRPLWPETFGIKFDLQVPPEVARQLGWNQLGQGDAHATAALLVEETAQALAPEETVADSLESLYEAAQSNAEPEEVLEPKPADEVLVEMPQVRTAFDQPETAAYDKQDMPPISSDGPKKSASRTRTEKNVRVNPIEETFEKLAKKFKKPELVRNDSRFPMYVIFSSKLGLEKKYGLQTRIVLEKEMKRLEDAIKKRPGWGAMVFMPDDIESANQLRLPAVDEIDPWKLKLALADLDQALSKKGAMIGALLIVGGPDVVPFHKLPNPTDDMDREVYSDNPYATVDGNYYVPEWPVGRLVGEAGTDAGMLLDQIRRLTKAQAQQTSEIPWWQIFLQPIMALLETASKFKPKSMLTRSQPFGYTASVWRRSSMAVFRPVGDGKTLLVSPPQFSGSFEAKKVVESQIGYYNLHGLEDTAEWYGQKDVSENYNGPDYPIALCPRDLVKNGRAPSVVFSEACYGAHITGKTEDKSIALKFLSIGSNAFVGSTGIAYGSVTTPLIGADLLAYLFWRYMKEGKTAGEALMRAKVDLVQQLKRSQGYLDGEDQKTLISFVLYGDPLATINGQKGDMKNFARSKEKVSVLTVSDNGDQSHVEKVVPVEILREVKEVVEDYLPGLSDAEIQVRRQEVPMVISSQGERFPDPAAKVQSEQSEEQVLVTMKKQVTVAHHVHHHFARVTLDPNGKMVKLAVSR